MSYKELADRTILQLNDDLFFELRDILAQEYVQFNVFALEDISKHILAEKICDYFEKVELKTGKSLGKLLDKYTSDIDSVVSNRIAKEPKPKKNAPTPPIPRARKYYDKAVLIKKVNKLTYQNLIDYSRLMFCLYTAIIKAEFKEIDDFDYSMDSLNITKIIDAMKSETVLVGKKLKFDIKNPYDSDRSTFILAIMMFFFLKNKEIIGEY